jgi:hypothetical protein
MIRQLIAPVIVATITFHAAQALAQGAFPAPLPGQAGAANDPAFPPVNGAAPSAAFSRPAAAAPSLGNAPMPSSSFGAAPASFPGPGAAAMGAPFATPPTQGGPPDDCMKEFMPLRQEAEKRGHMLKEASEKRQGAEVACKIINSFIEAEIKMIKYVETNSARCGIPGQIAEQLKKGHKGSEAMKEKICNAAAQMKTQPPAGPSLSDLLGNATAVPEATAVKKTGGNTFDTLSGNALTRRDDAR